jgi:hypothetical protein
MFIFARNCKIPTIMDEFAWRGGECSRDKKTPTLAATRLHK